MSEKHDAMWGADAGQYIAEQEAEISRLREWIVMADNRLEVADCPLCVEVARSYLKEALAKEGK